MATNRFLLGIICLAFFGRALEPGGDILVESVRWGGGKVWREEVKSWRRGDEKMWKRGGEKMLGSRVVESTHRQLNNSTAHQLNLSTTNQLYKATTNQRNPIQLNTSTTYQLNLAILSIARSQIGIREATGKNDGKLVEQYQRYTGNKKGDAWCASFVSWVFKQAGYSQPKTAWSPSLFPLARQRIAPLPADVFGIYFPSLGRIAHCGLVVGKKGNWTSTIEGNTNVAGSRDGDGVYKKLRHKLTIKVYADWLNEPVEGLK